MKQFSLISLLFVALCVSAFASENVFKSITFGFEVTKPGKWLYLSAQENIENIRRTKLSNEEFQQLMLKYASAPLLIMTKYPEPYDDLNPSFKVNVKPFGKLKGADAKQIISLLLPTLQKTFKDFELVQAPIEYTVAGLKGSYVRINYSLQISDGRLFPTTSELWIIPYGDYFFMIGAGTRQDEKNGSRKEIEQIVKSIKIDA